MEDLRNAFREYWSDNQITLEERLKANKIARLDNIDSEDMFKIEREVLGEIVRGFPNKEPFKEDIRNRLKKFKEIAKGKEIPTNFAAVVSYLFNEKGYARLPEQFAYFAFAREEGVTSEFAYACMREEIESIEKQKQ